MPTEEELEQRINDFIQQGHEEVQKALNDIQKGLKSERAATAERNKEKAVGK